MNAVTRTTQTIPPSPLLLTQFSRLAELDIKKAPEKAKFTPLPLMQALTFDVKSVLNGKPFVMADGSRATYDKEHKVIRLEGGRPGTASPLGSFDKRVVNLWLSDDLRNIVQIDNMGRPVDAGDMAATLQAGLMKPEVMTRMGFNQDDVKKAQAQERLDQAFLRRATQERVHTLPGAYAYRGKPENTLVVLQGQARILDVGTKANAAGSPVDGLYTFGAGPCSVMVVVANDAQGHPLRVGMAHLDAGISESTIGVYLQAMGLNLPAGTSLSVSLISGETETVKRAGAAIRGNPSANLKFADCDLRGERSDAVVVDAQGKIYYGSREDLNNRVDAQAMASIALQRQMVTSDSPVPFQLHIKKL